MIRRLLTLCLTFGLGSLLAAGGAHASRTAGFGQATPLAPPATPLPSPAATVPPEPGVNPFEGARWFIDPGSPAAQQATAWREARPEDAAEMDKIAQQPTADWFDNQSGDIATAVDQRLKAINAVGALPVFVAYNIPKRDCVHGGADSADDYRAWVRAFAGALGTRRAVIILEPDALANLPCLSATDQQTRLDLVRDAIGVFTAQPDVAVYVDAGHAYWIAAEAMAELLRQVGVERVRGFAINVASFGTTFDNAAYGKDLSNRLGGKHFIIDTSRNGLGPTPDFAWCNPPGRALGRRPTSATGDPWIDAYLWVKYPGRSDGTCNGGPVAGVWWPEYALGLAERAEY